MFSAKPKTPRPTGCCAQQMKRFHSLTAGQPFDTNLIRGAAVPLTTPRKGFFDSLAGEARKPLPYLDISEYYAFSNPAFTSAVNSGCGLPGRLWYSG